MIQGARRHAQNSRKWYPARDRSVYFGSVPFYRALAYRILVRGGALVYRGGVPFEKKLELHIIVRSEPAAGGFFSISLLLLNQKVYF